MTSQLAQNSTSELGRTGTASNRGGLPTWLWFGALVFLTLVAVGMVGATMAASADQSVDDAPTRVIHGGASTGPQFA